MDALDPLNPDNDPNFKPQVVTIPALKGREASAENTLKHMLELSVDRTLEPRDRIAAARVAMAKIIPDKKALEVAVSRPVEELADAELAAALNALTSFLATGKAQGRDDAPRKPPQAH